MVIGDTFTGVGGFSLAARWMGWRTAWCSEINAHASALFLRAFPGVPNLGDITRIDWHAVAPVDVLTAGFPCQPHSRIGKRRGRDDERDLWHEVVRAVGILRPRYVVLENVPALLTSNDGGYFGALLGDVARLGYDAEWRVFGAHDVGAPHQRRRLWVVAYRPFQFAHECEPCDCCGDEPWCARHDDHYADCACIGPHSALVDDDLPPALADASGAGLEGHAGDDDDPEGWFHAGGSTCTGRVRPGAHPLAWWRPQSAVDRLTDGLPAALDGTAPVRDAWERNEPRVVERVPDYREHVTALGNAIVPQCAFTVFQVIAAREHRIRTELQG